jgi:hypothetical protein
VATPDQKPSVKITQQFREAHNMTYELDCAGVSLIVRIFPLEGKPPADEWRVEARLSDAQDAVVAIGAGPTRAVALERVAAWWRENGAQKALANVDWTAIAQAMTTVRAI